MTPQEELKPFFEGVFEEVVPVAYSAGRADVFPAC
jgi:hypothetical protein